MRGSASCSGRGVDPVGDAGDVAGHRSEDVLDVGPGQAGVAGTAQSVGPDVLRKGGLDTGADRVTVLPLLGLLVEPVSRLDLM